MSLGVDPAFKGATPISRVNQPMKTWFFLQPTLSRTASVWAGLLLASALPVQQVHAVETWNGPYINFTNVPGSNPALPSSQDRLTGNVWLTRADTHGLYNAAVETSYSSLSPIGTEWAYGALSSYQSLNYQTWVDWNGKRPPSMVGQDAVLHLIPDDVFLAIRFTSWNVGSGGFSYTRSTQPVPEPSAAWILFAGATIAGVRHLLRRPMRW